MRPENAVATTSPEYRIACSDISEAGEVKRAEKTYHAQTQLVLSVPAREQVEDAREEGGLRNT